MKTRLLFWLIAGGPLACLAADPVRPSDPPASFVDPADPAVKAIRETGQRFIDRVAQTMIFEIERVVADHGLVKALETVHLKDLTLPKPEAGQPRITAIRRTSLNLRDPANRPDAADQAALSAIDSALRDGGDVPMVLVQKISPAGSPPEWRVYRPITTMPLCVKCHGPLDSLKPEIKTALVLKYPNDQATGFTAYKWRGVIRVSLTAP